MSRVYGRLVAGRVRGDVQWLVARCCPRGHTPNPTFPLSHDSKPHALFTVAGPSTTPSSHVPPELGSRQRGGDTRWQRPDTPAIRPGLGHQ